MTRNIAIQGAPILQTNQLFVALKEIGHVQTAPPDKPLLAARVVVEHVVDLAHYSSAAAAKKDVKEFQQWVAALAVD